LLPAYPGLSRCSASWTPCDTALGNPQKPVLGIVGGSKVSTKLDLLNNLVAKLDKLAIGGGMANTFLYAQGHDVGGSSARRTWPTPRARSSVWPARTAASCCLPLDVVVAKKVAPGVGPPATWAPIDDDDLILDAGPESVERLCRAMDQAKTLIWNGPLGVFEMPPFDKRP
jgi:phosphoglycerate kinase